MGGLDPAQFKAGCQSRKVRLLNSQKTTSFEPLAIEPELVISFAGFFYVCVFEASRCPSFPIQKLLLSGCPSKILKIVVCIVSVYVITFMPW